MFKLWTERGQLVLYHFPQNFIIDGKVLMDDKVAKMRSLLPRYLREAGLRFIRNVTGCFPQNFEATHTGKKRFVVLIEFRAGEAGHKSFHFGYCQKHVLKPLFVANLTFHR
ncbi:hypothetical protein N008_05235 [Hymenobacter sp. APR13]|nr:hypothetical protein N008_05235 [Hymenobacter sp. APR13]